jgi:GAF domain-containing protein
MRVHDWLECETIILIPVRQQNTLMATLVLARPASQSAESAVKGSNLWQPYISLAEQATTTLEKLSAVDKLQQQISAMQSLDAISKVIALETEPESLYRAIHQQLRHLLGDMDFLLAEYREADQTISIPYAYEKGEEINIPAMPLGQGLTSVLIKSKQPLLLSGNVQQQAQRLGARVIGPPAKSWMGVPLIVANQVIGAMILQDTRYENRFSETELRLVNTLSTQIAIAVRNARLYQESSRLAEQERLGADLTARVWSSPDIETILRVALEDLGSKLQAAEAIIELDVQTGILDTNPAVPG